MPKKNNLSVVPGDSFVAAEFVRARGIAKPGSQLLNSQRISYIQQPIAWVTKCTKFHKNSFFGFVLLYCFATALLVSDAGCWLPVVGLWRHADLAPWALARASR